MPIQFDHNDRFYRTSLEENALDYLVKTEEFGSKVIDDISYWKWLVISLHGALYHFMLAALVRSDQSGIYKKEIRDSNGFVDSISENLRVIDFLQAYKWIKKPDKMKKYVNSQFLESSEYNDIAMEELNNVFRNQFIHYKPISWGIEIEKIKEVVDGVLPILRFLISDSGNISWYNNTPQDAAQILDEIYKHLLPRPIP